MEVQTDIQVDLSSITQDLEEEERLKSSSGFQTFLMTGDAIIQVDKPLKAKSPRFSVSDKTNRNNTIQTSPLTTTAPNTNDSSNITLSNHVSKDATNTDTSNQLNNGVFQPAAIATHCPESTPSITVTSSSTIAAPGSEAFYDRKEFVPGFMRPEECCGDRSPSPELDSSTNRDSISGSRSSLGSLDDDISLDMNNLASTNTQQVDEPSASRLAKRLFYLDGFKRSDISYHLTRKYELNCFSKKIHKYFLS